MSFWNWPLRKLNLKKRYRVASGKDKGRIGMVCRTPEYTDMAGNVLFKEHHYLAFDDGTCFDGQLNQLRQM